MSRVQDAYKTTLTTIDALQSLLEELSNGKTLKDLNFKINPKGLNFSSFNFNVSLNPFDFLVMLLEKFMKYDDIVNWLSYLLVAELPAIELGIKGVILSTLKADIDCSSDPRIPEKFRMKLNDVRAFDKGYEDIVKGELGKKIRGESFDADSLRQRGAIIPISTIDFNNLLWYNPLNEEYGQDLYFGVKKYYTIPWNDKHYYTYFKAKKICKEKGINIDLITNHSEINTIWELARAEDWNAFLWFVTHKCQFTPTETLTRLSSKECFENLQNSSVLNVFNGFEVIEDENARVSFIEGDVIAQESGETKSTVLSLCLKSEKVKATPNVEYIEGKLNEGVSVDVDFDDMEVDDSNDFSSIVFGYGPSSILYSDPSTHNGKNYIFEENIVSGVSEGDFTVNREINNSLFSYTTTAGVIVKFSISGKTFDFSGVYDIDFDVNPNENQFQKINFFWACYEAEKRHYDEYAAMYKANTKRDLNNDIAEWERLSDHEKKARNATVTFLKEMRKKGTVNKVINGYSASTTNNNEAKTLKEATLDSDMYDFTQETYTTTFVPVSCNYKSANLYINRKNYFTRNVIDETLKEIKRNYEDEFALCNIEYMGDKYVTTKHSCVQDGMLKMTVMPKPFLYMPTLSDLDKGSLPSIKRITFDGYGNASLFGKYTVKVGEHPTNTNGTVLYNVMNGNNVVNQLVLQGSNYFLLDTSPDKLALSLHECYPGITIYEFNFDYIMGMRLFDSAVVADKLLTTLANFKSSPFTKYETEYQMRVAKIIDNIIKKVDTSEISDCFFAFSNDEYDDMLRKSEERRANLQSFDEGDGKSVVLNGDEIREILRGCNETASKVERVETISLAINKAMSIITEEMLPEDKYSYKCNFVLEMVKSLASIIAETLFSPKLMLILEFNKQLAGDSALLFSFEDVLKAFEKLLVQVIHELIEMVEKLILEVVLKNVGELLSKVIERIIAEQLDAYITLIREIVENCLIIPNFNTTLLDSVLDEVNYADIDDNIKIKTDEC